MNAPVPALVADAGGEVWDLLAGLALLRAQLWLGVIDQDRAGLSVILAVKPERGWLLLDVLREDVELRAGDALVFDTQVEGRRLRFECLLDRVAALEDGPAYVATAPRLLLDQQRRVAYRVRAADARGLRAAIVDPDGQVKPARLMDLSHLGCAARIELASPPLVGAGVQCLLRLDELQLTTEAEVRNARPLAGGLRLGLEFKPPTPAIEQQLAQLLSRLQRQLLRARG